MFRFRSYNTNLFYEKSLIILFIYLRWHLGINWTRSGRLIGRVYWVDTTSFLLVSIFLQYPLKKLCNFDWILKGLESCILRTGNKAVENFFKGFLAGWKIEVLVGDRMNYPNLMRRRCLCYGSGMISYYSTQTRNSCEVGSLRATGEELGKQSVTIFAKVPSGRIGCYVVKTGRTVSDLLGLIEDKEGFPKGMISLRHGGRALDGCSWEESGLANLDTVDVWLPLLGGADKGWSQKKDKSNKISSSSSSVCVGASTSH